MNCSPLVVAEMCPTLQIGERTAVFVYALLAIGLALLDYV